MTTPPDWINGGDPIQTHWLGKTAEIPPANLKWQERARWTTASGTMRIETGHTMNGRLMAYRIVGGISDTSRSLEGEIGWNWEGEDPKRIVAPLISTELWSSEWRRYCHGEIDHFQLVTNLQALGAKGTIQLQEVRVACSKHWLHGIMLLMLGVVLGCLLCSLVSFRNPPELDKQRFQYPGSVLGIQDGR